MNPPTNVRETLHDSDLNGQGLYEAYQDGTFTMTGTKVQKRRKSTAIPQLRAQDNMAMEVQTKPTEEPRSITCPAHEYFKQLNDEEAEAAFQDWKRHLKVVRLNRQRRQETTCARNDPRNSIPPNLTFHGFWAHVKKHSTNPRIIPHLYGQQDRIDNILYECHIKDRRTKVKQQQYMVTWADTYIRKEHIPLAAKDGYIAKDTRRCPIIRRIHGPVAYRRVLKASWEPVREPADTANIPQGMKEAFDDARRKAGCINLAKDNQGRMDLQKTNLNRQGYWPALQDKETSALLLEPGLAKRIHINTLDTVNPDQDIVATGAYTITMRHDQGVTSTRVANIYSPMGKVQGTITTERLEILHNAFQQSLKNCPEIHKQYGSPDFVTAVNRLLSRYTNDRTKQGKKSKPTNHCSIPNGYMKALQIGLGTTVERFASPLNYNPTSECYYSRYPEDKLFGANVDAFSCKWQGASQAHPEHEPAAMEKALRWAIYSAEDTSEPTLTAFVLPWWNDTGTSYNRWLTHPAIQEVATIKRNKFRFKNPMQWADGTEYTGNPKTDV